MLVATITGLLFSVIIPLAVIGVIVYMLILLRQIRDAVVDKAAKDSDVRVAGSKTYSDGMG